MGIVAVMRMTRGLVIVRQSLESMEAFGDLRGAAWAEVSKRHAPAETRRLAFAAVEEASDTGGVVRLRLWAPEPAEFTVRGIDDGQVLTTWRPLTHEERVEAIIGWHPSRLHPGLR